MKTLLLLIFFGKTILLNPTPITIGEEWIEIKPEKEFSAITGGAAILIDITHQLENFNDFEEVKRKFPKGTVSGVLITTNGKEIVIENTDSMFSNKEAQLGLNTNGPMPTDMKFSKLKLKSKIEIPKTKIYWKNGKL